MIAARVARVLALALLATACAGDEPGLPYYLDETLTPVWLDNSAGISAAHRIGDFSLVDQTGRERTGGDLEGKVVVASFFFTTCHQICPTLRSHLALVQEAFAGDDEVRIVSHTVTPEHDSVEVLAAYARANHIRAETWQLLTGDRSEIFDLARDSYLLDLSELEDEERLAHTERFTLVDGDGHIRGVYNGTLEFDVGKLIEDIRRLRAEDGGGAVLSGRPGEAP